MAEDDVDLASSLDDVPIDLENLDFPEEILEVEAEENKKKKEEKEDDSFFSDVLPEEPPKVVVKPLKIKKEKKKFKLPTWRILKSKIALAIGIALMVLTVITVVVMIVISGRSKLPLKIAIEKTIPLEVITVEPKIELPIVEGKIHKAVKTIKDKWVSFDEDRYVFYTSKKNASCYISFDSIEIIERVATVSPRVKANGYLDYITRMTLSRSIVEDTVDIKHFSRTSFPDSPPEFKNVLYEASAYYPKFSKNCGNKKAIPMELREFWVNVRL